MQTRDFTYIENVIKANLAACTAKDAPGKMFNIALGERITINALFRKIRDILGLSGNGTEIIMNEWM